MSLTTPTAHPLTRSHVDTTTHTFSAWSLLSSSFCLALCTALPQASSNGQSPTAPNADASNKEVDDDEVSGSRATSRIEAKAEDDDDDDNDDSSDVRCWLFEVAVVVVREATAAASSASTKRKLVLASSSSMLLLLFATSTTISELACSAKLCKKGDAGRRLQHRKTKLSKFKAGVRIKYILDHPRNQRSQRHRFFFQAAWLPPVLPVRVDGKDVNAARAETHTCNNNNQETSVESKTQ